MYKQMLLLLAVVGFAAAKPQFLPYAAPAVAVAPVAAPVYSAYAAAPVYPGFGAPLAYSGYSDFGYPGSFLFKRK